MTSSDKLKEQTDTVRVETLRSGAYPHSIADGGDTDPMAVAVADFDETEPTRAEQPRFAGADDTRANEVADEPTHDEDDVTRTGDFQVLAENCSVTRVGEPGWSG